MKIKRHIALAFILLIILTLSGCDAVIYCKFSGYVREANGAGIENVIVYATTPFEKEFIGVTDTKGLYTKNDVGILVNSKYAYGVAMTEADIASQVVISAEKDGYSFVNKGSSISTSKGYTINTDFEASPPPPNSILTTSYAQLAQRITNDGVPKSYPKVSSDSKNLVFQVIDNSKEGNLRYSLQGMTIGQLGIRYIAAAPAEEPALSPDGNQVLYVYENQGSRFLVRKPLQGIGMTYIGARAFGDGDSRPDISSSNEYIAFETKINNRPSICTVKTDGNEFTVYTEGSYPNWNPKRNLLAYSAWFGDNQQICILEIDKGISGVTQLTTGGSRNISPVWSPDGEWLAFVSDRDGKNHLYVMKADGSNITQLTTGEAEVYFPEWASDGYIYFVSNAGAPKRYEWPQEADRYAEVWRIMPELSK